MRHTAAKRHPKKAAAKKAPPATWVYPFADLPLVLRHSGGWDGARSLLGGKGANLAEMTRMGLPVPPGFVITTAACKVFQQEGRLPAAVWQQTLQALHRLELATGKRFGDPQRPLLLSCRSGARFSMPGMMDTVLDIGLDDTIADGMAKATDNPRFVFDAYRRLVQMYGTVVLGVADEEFEGPLATARERHHCASDADLPALALRQLVREFKDTSLRVTGRPFPEAPIDQLRGAIEAVFASWNGKRAVDYRNAAGIPHDLGTAVNIMTMVYGNLGENSATGVCTTRNVTTGEPCLEGDFLTKAQGEDVVSGTRMTRPIAELEALMPKQFGRLQRYAKKLERRHKDVQDIEFTIEDGKLWMLQTRSAKRTAQAAVRIAVDLATERLITQKEAVLRIRPEQVDYFLHPQLDAKARRLAVAKNALLATGLNVSPGAAIGQAAFSADAAERMAKAGQDVILVRPETKPDDVHGLLASKGAVTSHGGRTSHAALVARQFGKPAVVGASSLVVDPQARRLTSKEGRVVCEGDWLSIDGATGEIFAGRLPTVVPDIDDPKLVQLLGWADRFRRLQVWTNADYGPDAERARRFGAQGIGLCRTEHMFFEAERLPIVQALILSDDDQEREERLRQLLPLQRADFARLFATMDGLPVTIRLLDPPLHEFLPDHDALVAETADLRARLRLKDGDPDAVRAALAHKEQLLRSIERLREQNPMLGRRGVRLGIHMPGLVRMQVRAILEAACDAAAKGKSPKPKIMIPLTTLSDELRIEREVLEQEAAQVFREKGREVACQFGTMIEVPRAALTSGAIAEFAEFFSFGTNDLTQTCFGISRDDAETGFLTEYLQKGILKDNPFATIDRDGVGALMRLAAERGRARRPDLELGICGEHGGDPRSIAFCHEIGLDYVSCSPYRVPVARLCAAHASLEEAARAG